jgi:uncharacterized iron-regulated protein
MPAQAPVIRTALNDSSFRVIESATGKQVSFAAMVARAAEANVIFFGEQHDDPETHFLEFALLDGIGQLRRRVTLSLEMFERDVQAPLRQYLRGAVSESTFLASARPWPRYATDYRPMVQLARVRGYPVIAANIPRPLASAISRKGMTALDTLTLVERGYAARALMCPNDAYFARFEEAMGGHSAGNAGAAPETTQRFYEAQCAKDETMAESIVDWFVPNVGLPNAQVVSVDGIVLHVNGAFHSDYGQGTVARVKRRLPVARTLVITAVPVANPTTAVAGDELKKADYVIFTRKP